DSRQTRGFGLQLRSPEDIAVFAPPRLWTLQRALAAVAVLAACSLLGVAWISALRRRVRAQTRQIREQLERQARLEAEVQRAARLESLGVLAGGIAHDFNNLLTIILGNLGLAQLDEKLAPETSQRLQEIERGAGRARGLTQQLLTFAKGGEPVRTSVALADVVKRSTDLALHGTNVLCDYAFVPDLWPASVDKDQVGQAIQNLVLNAVQAMPQGGMLRVSLENATVEAGSKPSLEPGRYVKLALSDTGEGISPDVLPRIFDPYFTTRQSGSGLGLATVYSIVKRHHGLIEVESQPARGTTFTVWLPAADSPAPEPVATPVLARSLPPADAAAADRKRARVLLMDDEESIRSIVAAALQRMGLEGVTVPDGAAALREFTVAQHAGRPFDLVILDLTVPGGMGGRETIELLRKLDADVPAIVSSGYSSDPVLANFAAHGFQAMVAKPYELGQLVATVQRLLAAR
ncbi:MAG TPA: ATP-binding protein, partial [Opitutus sp.]|nr:ATP-binding protein [Opitutus sp.]